MMHSIVTVVLAALCTTALSYNFEFESIQLHDEDTTDFPAISFGNASSPVNTTGTPKCKVLPDSPDWPLDDEWAKLNTSLGGVLLKPTPPGAVCYNSSHNYDATECAWLLTNASESRFYLNDPLTVLTSWTQGNTCAATEQPQGNCTQGGFPVYVVNATTVRHVQIAVNFARNRNLRLVIKNTGHDFNGRSAGAGALSVWTHQLKSFAFVPEHAQGAHYRGMAARVAAGLESWEMYAYMGRHDTTLVVPGGSTVGAYGGWMAGGGHSVLGSLYGLGSDQPLSLQVVTADGRFVTADADVNADLYYALRGGGPGTYGVVTSAVVKAYPPLNVTAYPLRFTVGVNDTTPGNTTLPGSANVNDTEVFWEGFNVYNYFGKDVVDANGTAYSYVSRRGNTSFSFETTFEFPGKTIPEVRAFVAPLVSALNGLGIPVPLVEPAVSASWGSNRQGQGDAPHNGRFGSRLFPRRNWDDGPGQLFNATMRAIRDSVEAGYRFHGIHVAPTEARAGGPPSDDSGRGGGSGVNPAFRAGIMHADLFDDGFSLVGATPELVEERHARLNKYMDEWRAVTPGAGAYVNEADVEEPDWQHSFWGDKYDTLLQIKKRHDPWGLFWAQNTVGSEGWEVRTADGLPTQNGPLCRVNSTYS